MKRVLLIGVALFCFSAYAQSTQACQCIEYGTPICARFSRSDAVFVGQVVDVRPLKKVPDNVYSYLMVRFKVQEAFRGVSGPIVEVATATTMCDTEFKKSKRYLVYASLDNETNQLFTGMCTGTGLAYDINEIIEELRKLQQREGKESISGRIVTNKYQGLPGIEVEVKGNEKVFKTTTTKYGKFSISLPGPGSFTVRVSVPYTAGIRNYYGDLAVRSNETESSSTFEYDVTLEKSQCSYRELDLFGIDTRATAMVTGNALTAAGQGVDIGTVSLINPLDTGPDYHERLKKDGSFRFENVLPGDYYLVLNAQSEVPDESDAPYERTYYPATVDKLEAKKVQVTQGAIVENLAMRVGPRMTERAVAGTVRWENGRRLRYGYLAVYSGDEYVRRVEIEENGTFKFILYGDFDYSVEARDDIDEIEFRSQRVKIPPEDSTGHKLVIRFKR